MSHISRAQPPHVLVASTVQGLAEDVWLLINEGESILWSPGYIVSLIWLSTGLNVYVPMSSPIWEKSEAGSPRTWSPRSQMGPQLGTCSQSVRPGASHSVPLGAGVLTNEMEHCCDSQVSTPPNLILLFSCTRHSRVPGLPPQTWN